MSTRMVPNFLPRRKEKSSIPSCATSSTGAVGSAMRRRIIVIGQVCIPKRSVTRAPSIPEVGKPYDLNRLMQTGCHTRPRFHERSDALHKDFPRTRRHITKEFAHLQKPPHLLP